MVNPDLPIPADATGGLGAAGLIPVGGGIIDGLIQARTAKKNTEMTIEAQRAAAELAYQRQLSFWHMQNAYNSPEQQMKRFGAAGLNPHLIYGQGNSGNASGMVSYQAPNYQYRYAAPSYGAAMASVLPTLMSVGTWMQNMRKSEIDIQAGQATIDKARQLIAYLEEKNPREISRLDNALSLYPYQKSMADYSSQRVGWQVNDMIREYDYKWGSDRSQTGSGAMALDYIRKSAEARLKDAQASFTDFSITNPQALMQMVLGGVMGMAGQQLRLSNYRGPKPPKKVKTYYQDGKRRSQVVDYD